MEATELMIGDWVAYDGQPNIVRQLGIYGTDRDGDDYPAVCVGKPNGVGLILERNEIEPIPLTSEILVRNGFVLNRESPLLKEYICALGDSPDNNLFVSIYGKSLSDNRDFVKVCYCPLGTSEMIDVNIQHCAVHQLQHALRLCGIDKTIKL